MFMHVIAAALMHTGTLPTESGQILLSGDEQSGTDALALTGDMQSGSDCEEFLETI